MEDTPIHYGGAVKSLGNGSFEAPLVQFGDESNSDLARDFFTPDTDFWKEFPSRVPLLYSHGLDKTLKRKKLGTGGGSVEVTLTDAGVWMQGQLDLADDYQKRIYALIEAGKMGTSSGSAPHLVEREAVGKAFKITSWALVEASLTPTPCEPRNAGRVLPLKSLPTLLNPYPSDSPLAFPSPPDGVETLAAEMSIAAMQRLQDRLWSVVYDLLRYQQGETRTDRMEALTESVQQFAMILPRVVQSIMDGVAPDGMKSANAALLVKTLFIDRSNGADSASLVGQTLAEQGDAALLAVDAWTERLNDAQAKREAKDGRVISTANRAKIKAALDALTELYRMTEPRASDAAVQKALTDFVMIEARLAGVL